MIFFRNIILAFLVVGFFTRVISFVLSRRGKMTKVSVAYLSAMIVGVIIAPFVAAFVGFDVLISQYIIALITWLIIDLLWIYQTK